MTISNYTDEQLSARLGAAIRPENRASMERLSAAIEPRFIRCSRSIWTRVSLVMWTRMSSIPYTPSGALAAPRIEKERIIMQKARIDVFIVRAFCYNEQH